MRRVSVVVGDEVCYRGSDSFGLLVGDEVSGAGLDESGGPAATGALIPNDRAKSKFTEPPS